MLIGHSLGAHIALRFAATHPERVAKLVLVDGGIDVRAEVLDSLGPAINRLGVEFPSLDIFLGFVRALPMFAGRWNDYLERYFRYDVEDLPAGDGPLQGVAARHRGGDRQPRARAALGLPPPDQAPTLIFRAPDGLLTPTDCLMTQDEAEAMARAIPTREAGGGAGDQPLHGAARAEPAGEDAPLRAFLKGT